MQIEAERIQPEFTPVKVCILVETQDELDMLNYMMAHDISIPNSIASDDSALHAFASVFVRSLKHQLSKVR